MLLLRTQTPDTVELAGRTRLIGAGEIAASVVNRSTVSAISGGGVAPDWADPVEARAGVIVVTGDYA